MSRINPSAFIGGTPGKSNSTRTDVERSMMRPSQFLLGQNYPNPFNRATTIEFTLAQPGFVKIVIYDVRGRHITTLLEQTCTAGQHRATWHADVPSGVYFYRLEVEGEHYGFTDIKKLLLIK